MSKTAPQPISPSGRGPGSRRFPTIRAILRLSFLTGLLVATTIPARAQFGTNKIAYEQFDWHVYRAPHFDVHYYPAVEPFLEEIVSYAESSYLKISKDLDHELRFRVPMIVYKTRGEYRQTNVLPHVPEFAAAFSESLQYRMVLPIDFPPDELQETIAHELVHIFQFSMFFEGYLSRTLRASPPVWLMEGMASYLADDEDNLDRMFLRDEVVNRRLRTLRELNVVEFLTYRYGHAIFDFIEKEHGKEGMRSFLFEFRKVLMSNNLGRAIKEAFGYDVDEFNRRFDRYLRKKYFPVLLEKKSPDEYGTEIGLKKSDTLAPTLSPSGELVAVLAAPRMEPDLVVLSAENGKQIRNLTKGWTNRYSELVFETYRGRRDLSWSPVSDEIAVFGRKENQWPLLVFNALSGKLVRQIRLENIYECKSPTFSPDGRRVAFEGNRDGIFDIFEIDLESREIRSLTQDDFFDANPWYAKDGRSLLYNRRIGSHWKIFSVDLSDPSKKTQLTFGRDTDLQPSYSQDGRTVYFSSDRGPYGVFNIHSLDLETGDIRQYTDVVGGCFMPVEMAGRDDEPYLVFNAYYNGAFRLYRMPLRSPELEIEAAARLAEPIEAEPFQPDLQLKVDEENKNPYKVKWDIEAPAVSIGVTDDGTLLSNAALQFTDLLGNQRIVIAAGSVSDYTAYSASYTNLKRRLNWGANFYDYRDYFVDETTGQRIEREYAETAVLGFVSYPFSRHYRVEAEAGLLDSSLNQPVVIQNRVEFAQINDRLGILSASIVGDTTRRQSFGPFQGKRFKVTAIYGPHISGDFEGDQVEYRMDIRTYKQVTRRSLLAWRAGTVYNTGDREPSYGFGGVNWLRGYQFREFFGSRLVWSNLEFRFPLVDELRFPIFPIRDIRGFFFVDVGAAWYQDGLWYDPQLRNFRFDGAGNPIDFKFWDSDENRFQDGRGSYGVGFQFFFLGGLQFNWVWAHRFDYTQYVDANPDPLIQELVPTKGVTGGTRTDFYISFDF